jgi:GDP-L-fucose synthase
VRPAMLRKFHEAKENNHADVMLWGTGTPKREFLYVDDLANTVVFALENKMKESLYNVGSGIEISLKELAKLIQNITEHKGNIVWDLNKPDGTLRKLLDSKKINKIKTPLTELQEGILKTYNLKYIK